MQKGLKNMLTEQAPIINLLFESYRSEAELSGICGMLGLPGKGCLYCVTIFRVLNINQMEQGSARRHQVFAKANEIVCNKSREFVDNTFTMAAGHFGTRIYAISACRAPAFSLGKAECTDKIKNIIEEIICRCEENGILLSALTSQFMEGARGIATANEQAQELLAFVTMLGIDERNLTYEELCIPKLYTPERINETEKRIGKLLNALQRDDFYVAYEIIRQHIREVFVFGRLDIQSSTCQLYTLLNIVRHTLDHMRLVIGDEFFYAFDPMPKILYRRSIQEIELQLELIFGTFFQYIENNEADFIPVWLVRMTEYVQNNFTDPDLNVATIADRLGLNPAYSARMYKKHYGVGIPEQIHRLRISQARKLMGKGVLLKDIAVIVGYDNPQRMNRAFKRYEGIPPSEISVR